MENILKSFIKKIILFTVLIGFYQSQCADDNLKETTKYLAESNAYEAIFNAINKNVPFSLLDILKSDIEKLEKKINEAKKLIGDDFDINLISNTLEAIPDGETMLTWNVKCLLNHEDTVYALNVAKLLVETFKANINKCNSEKENPLMLAIKNKQYLLCRYILSTKGIDITKVCQNGQDSTLIISLSNYETRILKALLNKAKSLQPDDLEEYINKQDDSGKTALIILAELDANQYVDKADNLQDLLSCKPNVNLKDKDGNTALIYAVMSKNLDTVNLLLKLSKNLDLNLENNENKTALTIAQELKLEDIVKSLQGGDLTYRNNAFSNRLINLTTNLSVLAVSQE